MLLHEKLVTMAKIVKLGYIANVDVCFSERQHVDIWLFSLYLARLKTHQVFPRIAKYHCGISQQSVL